MSATMSQFVNEADTYLGGAALRFDVAHTKPRMKFPSRVQSSLDYGAARGCSTSSPPTE